jgi:hypothetical protein
VPPLPLLADGRHVIDALVELIGNALFVHENAQALRVREGRRRGEEFEFRCHGRMKALGHVLQRRIEQYLLLPRVRGCRTFLIRPVGAMGARRSSVASSRRSASAKRGCNLGM